MIGARILLLAAGHGRRAGGPKAWASIKGRTALATHVSFFEMHFGIGAVSATVQPAWRERCLAVSPSTQWIDADPDASALDSLQRLIRSAPRARSYVLHVDMPVHEAEVYRRLWAVDADAVVPTFGGRRGHPVLLSAQRLADVAALDGSRDRLDYFLRRTATVEAECGSAAVLSNVNGGGL